MQSFALLSMNRRSSEPFKLTVDGRRSRLLVEIADDGIFVAMSLSCDLRLEWKTVLVTRLRQSEGDGLVVGIVSKLAGPGKMLVNVDADIYESNGGERNCLMINSRRGGSIHVGSE